MSLELSCFETTILATSDCLVLFLIGNSSCALLVSSCSFLTKLIISWGRSSSMIYFVTKLWLLPILNANSDNPPQPDLDTYFLNAWAISNGSREVLCMFSTNDISKASLSFASMTIQMIIFRRNALQAVYLLHPDTTSKYPSLFTLTIIGSKSPTFWIESASSVMF